MVDTGDPRVTLAVDGFIATIALVRPEKLNALAATADFRIAEEHAKLGCPETGLGRIPGWSGTQRRVRRLGSQLVRRMAIAGEAFTAQEALRLGIVDQVVPKGASFGAAREL